MNTKPFLKWAGGKTQLIEQISHQLPAFTQSESFTFIEPFVGSGAMTFWVLNNFTNVEKIVINDIDAELIDCYLTIKHDVEKLITQLNIWEEEFHELEQSLDDKKHYYYDKRKQFNEKVSDKLVQSALFIFLNRTFFNGLYRVNRKNEFNVPIGSYKKPQICHADNLHAISIQLQKVVLLQGDYEQTLSFADEKTLFYFDPPYKPLNDTSSFNTYAQGGFDDKEQIRLAKFCEKLDRLGHSWILSNSDVRRVDSTNNFFDDLYAQFAISRVVAKRSINSNAKKRGELTELLIRD